MSLSPITLMSGLIETFRESTLLQCGFLEKLLDLDSADVAAFSDSMVEFLSPSPDNKFVYGLAAGRSALALYSFLQLIQNHFENVFPFTLEDPVQRHYRKGKNLGIAISGSGETAAVNKYIEDTIAHGGEIKLITANEGGTAYKLVSEYDRGSILVIKGRTKYATDKEIRSRLSPLGTEFELEVLAFLNAVFADIQSTAQRCLRALLSRVPLNHQGLRGERPAHRRHGPRAIWSTGSIGFFQEAAAT